MAKIQINNPRQTINGGAKKYYFKVKGLGGPKGDKGDKGDTGSRGPQGEPGNAATVYVGSTTTLEVGQDATVENVGTQYNAVLNFGIPQGPRGPQGIQGERGEPGQTGQTGPRGPQGERGTNATVYVGTTTTTNPGTQARVYNSGTDSNAVLNFEIPRGDVGPQPELVQTTGTSTTKAMSQNATTEALNGKQNALTAGQGIDITSDVISTPALVPEVVASLPAEGTEGKLYLTPKNYTRGTGTGNPIEATITDEAGKMESFKLDGNTIQQTYTGKNLWNTTPYKAGYFISPSGVETADGNTSIYGNIETSPNTTYTLTVKNLGVTANVRAHAYDENGKWINQIGVLFIATDEKKSMTFTTPANTKYLRWSFWEKNRISDEQVELGSTETSFEPFVGGQPSPSPDYPQPIQTVTGLQTVEIVGKNLAKLKDGSYSWLPAGQSWNISNGVINGTRTNSSYQGGAVNITTGAVAQWAVEPATDSHLTGSGGSYTITFSRSGDVQTSHSSTARVCVYGFIYDANGNNTSGNGQMLVDLSTATTGTYTLNLASDRHLGALVCYSQFVSYSDVEFKVQIEKGATATAYAPYSKQTLPINLGSIELCDIGGYQDYIHKVGEDWIITKRTTSMLLNEDSSIYRANFGTNPFYVMLPQGSGGADDTVNTISTHFYGIAYNDRTLEAPNSIFVTYLDSSPILYIRNTPWATIEDFKSWLSENNVKVYNKRAQIDTTITDQTLIAQLEAIRTASLENGANTITNTATGTNLAGDMEVGYYGYNPTNRYDKWLWLDINNEYEQIGE